MDFVDFKKHLQDILDSVATDTFEVSSIRNMKGNTKKVNVVFTPLAGSVYKNSATIPYQIDIWTKDSDSTLKIFTDLAKQYNSKSFISVIEEEEESKEYTVFEFYSTPAVTEKQVEFGTNRLDHLVMFANLNVLFEVGNVSNIKIDGEDIEFTSGNIAYAVETFSNRVSGGNLNKSVKKAATTALHFNMVNKTGVFTNKLLQIMFGMLDGSTKFTVEVKLTNGFVGTMEMIVHQNDFGFAKLTANLPNFNVMLSKA